MAATQVRGGVVRILFRYQDKQYSLPVGNNEAAHWKSRVEFWLMRLEQRLVKIPPGCSVVDFMKHDGDPPLDPALQVRSQTTLAELTAEFFKTVSNGAIEANTLATARIHLAHIEQTLGKKFILSGLTLIRLQSHIDRRCPAVSPVTAK